MGFAQGDAPRSRRGKWLAVLACAAAVAGCSQTPTSPSATAESRAYPVAAISQEPPAVPASIVPTPPQSLGATRFMAFGDSITYGILSSFDGSFLILDEPGSYPRLLRSMLDQYNAPQTFTVINEGVPGETARVGVDRLPGVLSAFPPDQRPRVVLLLEGINDLNFDVPVNQVADNVLNLVNIARLFNCTVLVSTMMQTYYSVAPDGRIRENSAGKIVDFNNAIRSRVAGLQNVHVIDMYVAFESGANRSLMGGDGLHPSPAGYERMAQTFHAAISNIFPVRGSLQ